jgi:hypothetical protein
VADYAQERNVPFLNMNTVFDGEAHINILQAEKVSDYVGAYLAQRYTWEDKRENPAFASWAEDCRYFTHKKDKCVQISTDDFSEYFANLQGKEWITLFSLKAEDAVSMSQEQKDALAALGISPDYDRGGNWCYMTILQGTSPVMEPVQVSDSFTQELTLEDGHSYGVSYETDEDGQWKSSLLMDGDNYSLDHTGINLFIYDSLLEEIVEFAAFDGGENFAIIRAE